jgi:hypothetical protein
MSQTHVEPDRGSNSTPRWVKVFGIVALVLVLLFVVLHLADPDRHGPRRHTQLGEPGSRTPPIKHGVQLP